MVEIIARSLLTSGLIYLMAGVLFTFLFLFKGIKKVDDGSHGSSWGFYIVIIPGCIMLWPLLLIKWMHHE